MTFRLSVSAGLASASTSVTVSVDDVNRLPIADAGLPQTVPEGTRVVLDGSASYDLDGDPLTYQWTQTAGPLVPLDVTDPVHPTFTAPAAPLGLSLTFQLTVMAETISLAVKLLRRLESIGSARP